VPITRIHVNGHVLRANRRRPAAEREAPLTVRRGRRVERASEVPIRDAAGVVVAGRVETGSPTTPARVRTRANWRGSRPDPRCGYSAEAPR